MRDPAPEVRATFVPPATPSAGFFGLGEQPSRITAGSSRPGSCQRAQGFLPFRADSRGMSS
jgi:hypothetical protein